MCVDFQNCRELEFIVSFADWMIHLTTILAILDARYIYVLLVLIFQNYFELENEFSNLIVWLQGSKSSSGAMAVGADKRHRIVSPLLARCFRHRYEARILEISNIPWTIIPLMASQSGDLCLRGR